MVEAPSDQVYAPLGTAVSPVLGTWAKGRPGLLY